MYRPRQRPAIFGVASIDLFASALGAFVILTLVSLPFFMNSDKSGQMEPLKQRYSEVVRENQSLRQRIEALQSQLNISINDLEILLIVDYSNSYASFLDGLEYELRTLARFWNHRGKELQVTLLLYGDQRVRYPLLQANFEPGDRKRLDGIFDLLRRIRGEGFQEKNNSHLNQDGPEALHLALEQGLRYRWDLPPSQRLVFIHYDNVCYPDRMGECVVNLGRLREQSGQLFMKFTRSSTSVDRQQAVDLATAGEATFIDSGQSWTLQIFHHADRMEQEGNKSE